MHPNMLNEARPQLGRPISFRPADTLGPSRRQKQTFRFLTQKNVCRGPSFGGRIYLLQSRLLIMKHFFMRTWKCVNCLDTPRLHFSTLLPLPATSSLWTGWKWGESSLITPPIFPQQRRLKPNLLFLGFLGGKNSISSRFKTWKCLFILASRCMTQCYKILGDNCHR